MTQPNNKECVLPYCYNDDERDCWQAKIYTLTIANGGKYRMEEKFGLTLVYLNFKKLVKWIANIPLFFSKSDFGIEYYVVKKIFSKGKKINLQI